MADLAPGYAIDRKVAEECGGAQIRKRLANFRGVDTVRIFDGGFGQHSRRIRFRRVVVASDGWRMHPHSADELRWGRSELGLDSQLILPLARTDNSLALVAQIGAESFDPRGNAGEDRNIQIGFDDGAHHREIVIVASRADQYVDAISPQSGKYFGCRF